MNNERNSDPDYISASTKTISSIVTNSINSANMSSSLNNILNQFYKDIPISYPNILEGNEINVIDSQALNNLSKISESNLNQIYISQIISNDAKSNIVEKQLVTNLNNSDMFIDNSFNKLKNFSNNEDGIINDNLNKSIRKDNTSYVSNLKEENNNEKSNCEYIFPNSDNDKELQIIDKVNIKRKKLEDLHIKDFLNKRDFSLMDDKNFYLAIIVDMDSYLIKDFLSPKTIRIEDVCKAFDIVVNDFIYCLKKEEPIKFRYSSSLILTS